MSNIETYVDNVDPKWSEAYQHLKEVIDTNIPDGFECVMQYGMPTYVVPLSSFPEGYLGKKDTPLPFISLAAQKNHLALYHLGVYGDEKLMDWFTTEYPNYMDTKLNMGKSCIRFTNPKKVPYDLIGELVSKVSVEDWVNTYEKNQANK